MSKQITGAQALIEALLQESVDTIFGYPGGAIMPVYDALYDYRDSLRHILVRHEQAAAHAAEGYARLLNKPGVCFATSGPGATNLVTGILDAMMDSIPLVCITGQVASHLLGTMAFQEADIVSITKPITKWNVQITDPKHIPAAIAKAFFIASSGRPGPVLIDITKDAQLARVDYSPEMIEDKTTKTQFPLHPDNLAKAAELINTAERPFMLIGHGVHIAKADKEVRQIAELCDMPVAATLHGLSVLPAGHPLFMGFLGMHGNYAPNILTNKADMILAVGMRFDDRVTGRLQDYAKQAKIIHVEIDPKEIDKNVKTDVALVGDAKHVLQSLLPLLKPKKHDAWVASFKVYAQVEHEKVIRHDITPLSGNIRMAEVIHALSNKTDGRAVLVTDVGQHQMLSARYYRFQTPNSIITSGGAGTMGFALPAAIGAKVAQPERDVVAVIGDGGFQMTIQEMATIAQEHLGVKIIILNNHYLGMVRQWQELFFDKRYSFVSMHNPDFIQVAKGFGIDGTKVTGRDELNHALDRLFSDDKPYILDIHVERETNVFPMIASGASVEEVRLE